jgi:hypothetical protein
MTGGAMNAALEKLLTELEAARHYGVVEIHYANGIPAHVNVKKTYKLQNTSQGKPEEIHDGKLTHQR